MADNDGGANLAWFLAGAAIGAAAALLLAPQEGAETREMLRRRASAERERFADKSREAVEKGREYYDRGKDLAEEAARSGREAVDKGRELYEKGKGLAEDTAAALKRGKEAEAEAES